MAAPAVCRADKEDSPGVAHFRPLSFLCCYPGPPPQAVPSSPRFWAHVGLLGQRSFSAPGIRQARTLLETAASRRLSEAISQPPTARSSAPPGSQWRRSARAPDLPGSPCPEPQASHLGPKVWSFAQILRFLSRSHPFLDTHLVRFSSQGIRARSTH